MCWSETRRTRRHAAHSTHSKQRARAHQHSSIGLARSAAVSGQALRDDSACVRGRATGRAGVKRTPGSSRASRSSWSLSAPSARTQAGSLWAGRSIRMPPGRPVSWRRRRAPVVRARCVGGGGGGSSRQQQQQQHGLRRPGSEVAKHQTQQTGVATHRVGSTAAEIFSSASLRQTPWHRPCVPHQPPRRVRAVPNALSRCPHCLHLWNRCRNHIPREMQTALLLSPGPSLPALPSSQLEDLSLARVKILV